MKINKVALFGIVLACIAVFLLWQRSTSKAKAPRSCGKGVTVEGSTFKGEGKAGDFAWEIENEWDGCTLYVFNDNIEKHGTAEKQKGNAGARPYNKYGDYSGRPRSAGVTTGSTTPENPHYNGFKELKSAKQYIDSDIDEIKELLKVHKYDKIKYSRRSDKDDGLGTGIFKHVHDDVRKYIVNELKKLARPSAE